MVSNVSDEEMQEHYDNFFEDVFVECEDKVSDKLVCYKKKLKFITAVFYLVKSKYIYLFYSTVKLKK